MTDMTGVREAAVRGLRPVLLGTLCGACLPGIAPAAQSQAPGIEEVIVTAQRREGSLQQTPISITAFSGDDLSERLATNLADVGNFVPNMDFSTATQSSRSSFVSAVFVRGVGQTDFIVTTDPGVGIYVDGVYYGRTTGGVVDLLDIERIEVLRGPQGTLFGKNTIGGALNVVSSTVGKELGGRAELTVGRFDRVQFRGDLNVPISDRLSGRVAVSVKNSSGYGERRDFASGNKVADLGADDSISGRARLRWTPSADVEANFSFDYTRVREPQVPDHIAAIDPGAPLLGLWNALVGFPSGQPYTPAFLSPGDYATYATGPNRAELDLWGPALSIE